MILEAARAGRNKGQPPPELNLVFQWQRWGVLPRGGGLLDQPAGLLERMELAWTVYEACRLFYAEPRGSQWRKANQAIMDVIRMVNGLDNGFDG